MFLKKIISICLRWWADKTMNFPPPKSQGRTVMTSDFATILDGLLSYNDEAWELLKNSPEIAAEIELLGERRAKRGGTVLDVSSDGYYDSSKCIPDFEKVSNSDVLWVQCTKQTDKLSPSHMGHDLLHKQDLLLQK